MLTSIIAPVQIGLVFGLAIIQIQSARLDYWKWWEFRRSEIAYDIGQRVAFGSLLFILLPTVTPSATAHLTSLLGIYSDLGDLFTGFLVGLASDSLLLWLIRRMYPDRVLRQRRGS